MLKDKIEPFYNKNYKILMLIPILILIISLAYIGYFYSKNNDFIYKDISLKGGISATVYTEKTVNLEELSSKLDGAYVRQLADLTSGRQLGLIIETDSTDNQKLKEDLQSYLGITLDENNYSVEQTSPSLGSSFYKELIFALIFSFVFMAIVVLIAFRTIAPSLAVIFAAFADVIVTLAFIDFIGMRISAAGIIGFLLVIGYSIDTDMLLTTRAIKRSDGSLFERMFSSVKTGLTMTLTTLTALTIGYILTTSPVLKEIFIIIIIALIVDIFSTYLTNTGILKLYCDKKGIK
ncbi:MAG: hypothetical protein KJ623_01685 [Nanoarchaeota archaeon]|nr:hypothetical protein [Nanoarchaeota archaeon]MBU0962465.1 hypothetical protein [Nanoarchaeota archaeon]